MDGPPQEGRVLLKKGAKVIVDRLVEAVVEDVRWHTENAGGDGWQCAAANIALRKEWAMDELEATMMAAMDELHELEDQKASSRAKRAIDKAAKLEKANRSKIAKGKLARAVVSSGAKDKTATGLTEIHLMKSKTDKILTPVQATAPVSGRMHVTAGQCKDTARELQDR